MMRLSVSVMALGLVMLGGCSTGSDDVAEGGQSPAAARSDVSAAARRTGAVRPAIASLPDTGDLLRYDSVRKVEPSGAYTSYPVSLSEAHAFQALQGGELAVTTPDGERLHLQPQGHEEYPDGNWTLIASDRSGTQSLLTFGQDAVFGSITRADGSVLRVTTRHRQVYVVAADPEQLARLENPGETERVDMLVPPARLAAAAQTSRAASSGQVQAQAATDVGIAAANEIEVLLGYTNGLVARIGSESGAVTRMQNLVAITNEAYGNSGVTLRMRLVRSMLVNYTDNNTNQTALQSLTGSSGSGSVPIDPAFNALRAAREESGADLVSLVRQFREPENDGCGIAWLLGGGQTAITQSDASFGYSVVSDGSDVRESDGKTYFCRDETFAHELGHNMGQAHNQEDSTSAGAHAYSYGYREAAANGFFTIMAYRLTDSSQVGIRYFANPSVNDPATGRPTGIANQSDNARSMNQTMPIIVSFRASTTPGSMGPGNDHNGDGRSDIFWFTPGQFAYSLMNGAAITSSRFFPLSSSYVIAATGDYNGDGRSDLLWTSNARDLYIWFASGTGFTAATFVGNYAPGWSVVRADGDANGDGKSDIFWQTTGQFAYSLMDGATILSSRFFGVSSAYSVAAVADYDGNDVADVLWTSAARDLYIWRGTGSGYAAPQFVSNYGSGWQIVPTNADINGDNRSDLVFQAPGSLSYSLMNGATITSSRFFGVSSQYTVAATGDYDGDSRTDILWTSAARDMYIWFANPTGFGPPQLVGSYAAGWTIVK